MIDTLHFNIDRRHYDRDKILKVFYEKFKFKSDTRYTFGTSIKATYLNWTFRLTGKELKCSGSLTKLWIGNNLQNLPICFVPMALKKLEEILEIKLGEAQIKRIDVGCTLPVSNSCNLYLDMLVRPAAYSITSYENQTKMFRKWDNTIVFYDKRKEIEARKTAVSVPQDINYLRYEIRHIKRIKKVLETKNCNLSNLYSEIVLNRLMATWYESYRQTPKLSKVSDFMMDYETLDQYKMSLIYEGVRSFGGVTTLLSDVRKPKGNRFSRKRIRDFLTKMGNVEPFNPVLQEELDRKIEEIYLQSLL